MWDSDTELWTDSTSTPTSGDFGFWNRTSAILSPATAEDKVDVIITGANKSALYGRNDIGYGIRGVTDTVYGVFGEATDIGSGIYGISALGTGIYGQGGSVGTYGVSAAGKGIEGQTGAGYGLYGSADGAGIGVHGDSGTGYSGQFIGGLGLICNKDITLDADTDTGKLIFGLDTDAFVGWNAAGFLEMDSADTRFSGDIRIADDEFLYFGAGPDVSIRWDNSNSYLSITSLKTLVDGHLSATKIGAGTDGLAALGSNLSVNIADRFPVIRQELIRDEVGDNYAAFYIFDLYATNSFSTILGGRIGWFGEVKQDADPINFYMFLGCGTATAYNNCTMKLDANNKVGIGLSLSDRPAYMLDVNGDVSIRADNAHLYIGNDQDIDVYYDNTDAWLKTNGHKASDLIVDCGTNKTIKLADTVWDDHTSELLHNQATNPSAHIVFDTAEGAVTFKTTCDTGDWILGSPQMPHKWKYGTAIYPHLHWWQTTANTPNWLIQYRWQRNGQAKTTAWTNLPQTTNAFTWVSGTLDQITYGAAVSPPANYSISDIIQFRLIRDVANGSGAFSGAETSPVDADGISFDYHYEIDTLGSRQEYIK